MLNVYLCLPQIVGIPADSSARRTASVPHLSAWFVIHNDEEALPAINRTLWQIKLRAWARRRSSLLHRFLRWNVPQETLGRIRSP